MVKYEIETKENNTFWSDRPSEDVGVSSTRLNYFSEKDLTAIVFSNIIDQAEEALLFIRNTILVNY